MGQALDEELRQRVDDCYGDQFDFEKISRILTAHSAGQRVRVTVDQTPLIGIA